MNDSETIANNSALIETAKEAWKDTTPKDRENWIRTFGTGGLLSQLCDNNAAAPSGDPEDADVPECPSV